ncbi:MAG: hypothetical protein EOP19_13335, partial [Hyphomicrobiales bacterium]
MDKPARPQIDVTARCACGRVELHLAGEVKSMFLCSCEDCQKASGTGHSAAFLLRAADVSITGSAKTHARPADSGAIFTRWFCPVCGTPLCAQSSRGLELMTIPVGLLGAAALPWFKPNQLLFARTHR